MKKFSIALAAVAAFALASTSLFACDAEKTASAGTKTSKMACCAKGANSKVANGAKCAAHADKAASKMECAGHASKTAAAGVSCPMAAGAKKTEVAMTGKLLCEHCNLHKSETCNSVFQANGSDKFLPLCPEGKIADAKKASDEGKNVLDVKGYVCENGKGEKMLMISSFTVKS